MSDIAIRVENLGKRYRIGQTAGYKTLRDSLTNAVKTPFRRGSRERPAEADAKHIWALKEVSFEIKRGEAVGIIGKNGSGKSTLLKILSRITAPTEGLAEIHGRASSLLEVGTGFHPELSGRENIYLNGAVLGMKKAETDRRLEAIVAFSEIGQFLDTPVKRYSSGMYVRLAFAVAAHLEPDILLVDEVLAVGDAKFQKKCLEKMNDVTREGRTVVFVSHSMAAVASLCSRAVLLEHGRVAMLGGVRSVEAAYVGAEVVSTAEITWSKLDEAPGNDKARLHRVAIVSGGSVTGGVDIQNEVRVEIEYWNLKAGARLSVSIHLLDQAGMGVLASANMHSANLVTDPWFGQPQPLGLFSTTCVIPGNFLNEGRYSINAVVLTGVSDIEVFAREVVSFTVIDTGVMRKEYKGNWLGVVRPRLAWATDYRGTNSGGQS